MASFMLYSIDEAIDCKYIVTKTLSGQAKAGTLIHIMDTTEKSDGIQVDYRVTRTGQNFVIKFENLKQFCKWARPDSFLARHYDSFSKKEVLQYLKVSERTFTTFCVPLMAIAVVLVWLLSVLAFDGALTVVFGIILSLAAVAGVFVFFRLSKEKVLVKMYGKVNVGISFK